MHERNQGKGAAIRTAARAATGDDVIMCDADLEYSPADIPALLAPVIERQAEVVYGTRTFGSHNAYSYLYVLGNKWVTTFANVLLGSPRSSKWLRHGGRDHREAAPARHPAL